VSDNLYLVLILFSLSKAKILSRKSSLGVAIVPLFLQLSVYIDFRASVNSLEFKDNVLIPVIFREVKALFILIVSTFKVAKIVNSRIIYAAVFRKHGVVRKCDRFVLILFIYSLI